MEIINESKVKHAYEKRCNEIRTMTGTLIDDPYIVTIIGSKNVGTKVLSTDIPLTLKSTIKIWILQGVILKV